MYDNISVVSHNATTHTWQAWWAATCCGVEMAGSDVYMYKRGSVRLLLSLRNSTFVIESGGVLW